MLRSVKNLIGYRLLARGEKVGRVYDFYIDDRSWRVRYLVAEIGSWPGRRRVLVARGALGTVDGEGRVFHVSLTRQQIETAPDIDTDKPVSRQQEMLMNAHYGWPADWAAETLVIAPPILDMIENRERTGGNPHLRSFREISSYRLRNFGQIIAAVKDFVLEDCDWSISLVVASTGGWLDSRRMALPAATVMYVSWSGRSLSTTLTYQDLERLPTFRPDAPVNQQEEVVYFDYHGRPVLDNPSDPSTGK